jgi:streptomycin 6-kinase
VAGAGLTHDLWLERVPQLLNDCAAEWALRLGPAYPQGAAGYAVRAKLDDGTLAVLKLVFPHREAEHEADALRTWGGDGAVELLRYDAERWAMLIERCEPGTLLAHSEPDTALDVLVALLPRLWKRVDGLFHTLADEVAWWLSDLPSEWERAGRPFEDELLEYTMETLAALAGSQGEQVLLHQDLHTDNVLAAQREPWLVIDPKPLVGEREFAVAPIVRDYVLGHSRADVLHRLDRLTSQLGLDRERALAWTIGQTVAWMFDSTQLAKHLETVRWLVEARG